MFFALFFSLTSLSQLHCANHKLALGANDAANEVEFSAEIDALLRALGRLVRRSAKRTERLHKLAEDYDEGKKSIKRLHAVRWLSRGNVLVSVCENINALYDLAVELQKTPSSADDDDECADGSTGDDDCVDDD